jgi:hypothetical protein
VFGEVLTRRCPFESFGTKRPFAHWQQESDFRIYEFKTGNSALKRVVSSIRVRRYV